MTAATPRHSGMDSAAATVPPERTLARRFASEPVRVSLVALQLVGVYTNLTLRPVPTIPIPATLALPAGLTLLLLNVHRIRREAVLAMLGIGTVAGCSVWFQPDDGLSVDRLKGLAHLLYSLTLSYALFLELSRWRRREVAGLFATSCGVILAGCALEHWTRLKALSDAFRERVLVSNLYENLDRDLSFFWTERPKLFTTEPSYVAHFLLTSATIWFAVHRGRGRLTLYALIAAAGLLLIGSPILLLAPATAAVVVLFLETGGLKALLSRASGRRLAALAGVTLVALLLATIIAQSPLSARFEQISTGDEGSFAIRVVVPAFIAWDAIAYNPWWGVGITGEDALQDTWRARAAPVLRRWSNRLQRVPVHNLFWAHWTYLGLAGGTLMLVALRRLAKALGVRHLLYAFLLVLIFGQSRGAYVGIRDWTVIFLVFLSSMLATREARGLRVGPPRAARSDAGAP